MIWNNLSRITFVEPLLFSFVTLFLFVSLHFVGNNVVYFSGLKYLDNPLSGMADHPRFPLLTAWRLSPNSLVYSMFHRTWTRCLVSDRHPASY